MQSGCKWLLPPPVWLQQLLLLLLPLPPHWCAGLKTAFIPCAEPTCD